MKDIFLLSFPLNLEVGNYTFHPHPLLLHLRPIYYYNFFYLSLRLTGQLN